MKKTLSGKSKIVLLAVIAAIILLIGRKVFPTSDYQKAVANFNEVTVEQVEEKIEANESFLLFVGRETCPECVEIAPVLAESAKASNSTIYYLDSINTDTDEKLSDFRKRYTIQSVPTLVHFHEGTYSYTGLPSTVKSLTRLLETFK